MWWLIGAAGLGIPLVLTAVPEFGMFGIGAVAAAVAAALGAGVALQIGVFAVVSAALVGTVGPIARRHLRRERPEARTGIEALRGANAVVLSRVDAHGGRIKLAGEEWSARALDTGQVFEPGETVDVVEIKGATAIVM
ncbi:NfeD family protein [Allostreptomyces psammosilenae]|nr:NfeD family protein [Allostreptomyces psammosilenae]